MASVLISIVIAFGVGPSWIGRRRKGTVCAKLIFHGGNTFVGEEAEGVQGNRYYLRIELDNGEVTEWWVRPEQFRSVREGDEVWAKVIGRRALFVRPLRAA